jgi:hypothetical protein
MNNLDAHHRSCPACSCDARVFSAHARPVVPACVVVAPPPTAAPCALAAPPAAGFCVRAAEIHMKTLRTPQFFRIITFAVSSPVTPINFGTCDSTLGPT